MDAPKRLLGPTEHVIRSFSGDCGNGPSRRGVIARRFLVLAVGLTAAVLPGAAHASADCHSLVGAQLQGPSVVISAESIQASDGRPWQPPKGLQQANPVKVEFCRVLVESKPTPGSGIQFEFWLPARWNGKFFGTSSGGLAGIIDYVAMAGPIGRGYATMGHNNGHYSGPTDLSWAIDPSTGKVIRDRVIDFAWRSTHVSTVAAKELAERYYASAPTHSYYMGCSQGGHHGQIESQRFPGDYDGIVAGGGGADWTGIMASEAWAAFSVVRNNHAGGIPRSFLPAVAQFVMASCDKLDGLEDGQIDNPLRCKPNLLPLKCRSGQTANCLTAAQIAATEAIYRGWPTGPGGHMPGSEANWVGTWNAETQPGTRGAYAEYFRLLVHQDPTWKFEDFSWPEDVQLSRKVWDSTFSANDPDMSPFASRGGKLILYAGWADGLNSPAQSLHYWARLQAKMGKPAAARFARLFMVPSGGHCGQGLLDQRKVDWLTALENWVEKGLPPDPTGPNRVMAPGVLSDGRVRKRILCPYPSISRYKGRGDINDPDSFVCSQPGEVPNLASRH